MKRSAIAVLLATLIVGFVGPQAQAHGRGHHGKSKHSEHHKRPKPVELIGVITAVSVDTDPATQDSFTVRMLRGNRRAKKYQDAHPGDLVINLQEKTRFGGPWDLGAAAADYRIGDGVHIKAKVDANDALVACWVRLRLQVYEGTIATYDATGGTVSVQWDEANGLAHDWLASHGNPNPVSANLTPDTSVEREGGGDPQAGDEAKLAARPTADGSGLEAVAVRAEAPDADEDD